MNSNTPETAPTVLSRTVLGQGRWLGLEELLYRDAAGVERRWESVSRKGGRRAACMIARCVPSDRIVLIRQFRPPAGGPVLEFPAGLIDDGEGPEDTAVRELLEETGYRGAVVSVSPPVYNTPGMTDEAAFLVCMEIDEALPENQAPTADPDPGEHIEVFTVPLNELYDFLMKRAELGDRIEGKLLMYTLR